MLLSSIGDWTGIIAVAALVARLGGARGGAFAVAGVMLARLIPLVGFGPFAGVLVDRFDRRTLMVVADIGRAALYGLLPFVGHLAGIFAVSFLIEVLALLWGPALDAALPNVVPADRLAKANSINLLTSYGTLPVGALLFTLLAAVSRGRGGVLGVHPEAAALWVDALSFGASALIVSRLDLGRRTWPAGHRGGHRIRSDLIDEWRFLRGQTRVRALIASLAVGFVGAGALTALGPLFAIYSLGVGDTGYGLLITALGIGLAIGMVVLMRQGERPATELGRRLTWSLLAFGACLILLGCTTWLVVAGLLTLVVGMAGGTPWVCGYTLLQQQVVDDFRGRTFALLTVVARFALLTSRVVFPLVAGVAVSLAGTRLALVAAGGVVLSGALISRRGATESP